MDNEQRKMELVRWAKAVQFPPEGYEPIPGLLSKRQFGVCTAENVNATPGERYAVSAARVSLLNGRDDPLPGEPFTKHFSRRGIAEREYVKLVQTLG